MGVQNYSDNIGTVEISDGKCSSKRIKRHSDFFLLKTCLLFGIYMTNRPVVLVWSTALRQCVCTSSGG